MSNRNKMSKMSRSNVKARRWMEKNDYKNIYFFNHTRWSKDLHFEGLEFDGLASVGTSLVLFQIKSNCRATKSIIEQYKLVSQKYGIKCLWFNAIDRKGLEVNNVIQEAV